MRVSSNYGASFGSAIRITTNTGYSGIRLLLLVGATSTSPGRMIRLSLAAVQQSEIWMRVSSNNGGSFGSAIRITTNTGDSVDPSVAASGSYVYVAWEDYTPVTGSGTQPEIWMRVSSNNGGSFGSAIRISTNTGHSVDPSVAAAGAMSTSPGRMIRLSLAAAAI